MEEERVMKQLYQNALIANNIPLPEVPIAMEEVERRLQTARDQEKRLALKKLEKKNRKTELSLANDEAQEVEVEVEVDN